MIGISVSDIIKLLEQVPGWKAVVGLPKRLAELEARVKALEEAKGAAKPNPRDCPICGARMTVVSETDHPTLGPVGVKVHAMRCDGCGNTASRNYSAGSGYG
jgi:hypothetical protein